jgi:hypothetical protein
MMSEDRPIKPQPAALAAKAAGLDLERSLSEQLKGDRNGDLERQVAELSEKVEALSKAGVQHRPPQPHEELAERLHTAKSEWVTLGGPDREAA